MNALVSQSLGLLETSHQSKLQSPITLPAQQTEVDNIMPNQLWTPTSPGKALSMYDETPPMGITSFSSLGRETTVREETQTSTSNYITAIQSLGVKALPKNHSTMASHSGDLATVVFASFFPLELASDFRFFTELMIGIKRDDSSSGPKSLCDYQIRSCSIENRRHSMTCSKSGTWRARMA